MSFANVLKVLGAILICLAGAILLIWVGSGSHMVTQYQVETVEVEEDEFGDKMERTVMRDEFRFGLLPDKFYDGAAPWMGLFFVVGLAFLIVGFRKDPSSELAAPPESETSGAPK